MELQVERALVPQLAALPPERSSTIYVKRLVLPARTGRKELEQQLQQCLSDIAPKRPNIRIEGIESVDRFVSNLTAAGFSPLEANCPIKLKGPSLQCTYLDITEPDVQGMAAAWGASLKDLVLCACTLSAAAWAAITATAFPALKSIIISEDSHTSPDWESVPDLLALSLNWPEERQLSIRLGVYLSQSEEVSKANRLATKLQGILEARGKHNPSFCTCGSQRGNS
jgi:hypothetical protein